MRDIITIPLNREESLIIASDNSGGIGMKAQDHVNASYETVAYYSFRVTAIECIAAGGQPFSVVLHNFCGDDSWSELVNGIQKGLIELNLMHVSITGSTESNFQLNQSAIGLMVIGKKPVNKKTEKIFTNDLKFGVIGIPLVGNEVIDQIHQIVPLSIVKEVSLLDDVIVWPVGSKGILSEFNQMFPNKNFTKEMLDTELDVLKSAGPSTCIIIAFDRVQEENVKEIASEYFHSIRLFS
jgi:hypothetical protein